MSTSSVPVAHRFYRLIARSAVAALLVVAVMALMAFVPQPAPNEAIATSMPTPAVETSSTYFPVPILVAPRDPDTPAPTF